MCYSTSTQQKSLPLGGDLGEAYHQKIAYRADFLIFLHKNLYNSNKCCIFAAKFPKCVTKKGKILNEK